MQTMHVGYTAHNLHQRKIEHQHSVIGKHRWEEHGLQNKFPDQCFTVLKKCKTKFDCLIYEMKHSYLCNKYRYKYDAHIYFMFISEAYLTVMKLEKRSVWPDKSWHD